MKSILKIVVLILTANFLFVSSVFGQLTGWKFSTTIDITENAGSAYTDYPIIIYINTATLIANGQMNPSGNDIRFATDCAGTTLIPYYIESGINTDSTKIWIRMPQILALNNNTIYFFSGNNLAPAGSNFAAVFPNAFFSAGNQTLSGAQNYDWFQVNNGDTIFVTPGSPIQVNASKILINGVIDGDTAGYAGGALNSNGSGPGGGQTPPGTNTFADGGGGGGYGGVGGNGGYEPGDAPGAGGNTYGTPNGVGDIDMGSGGGAAFDILGGDGGGAIQLTGFDVVINGTLLADGQDAPFADLQGSGGGAGGGVLAVGQFLTVTGAISANGGSGSSPIVGPPFDDGGGGGGGGRIKGFYYSQGTLTGSVSVTGGNAGCCGGQALPQNGSNGSIYSSQLYGAFGVTVNPLTLKQSPGITSGTDTACINSTETYVAGNAGGLNYFWNIVGGSVTSGQYTNTVQVTWTTAGTDSIELVTTNSFTGCSDTVKNAVVISNVFPTADFTYGAACANRVTNFVDESTISTGTIANYNWSFGDGGTSTDRNPRSFYSAASIYSVTLTVTSALGCSNSKIEDVPVLNPPTADFNADNVCFGQPTGFTNTSSGASYVWYLGDGSTSTLSSFDYTYSLPGTYVVSLVATNVNGCGDSISQDVIVYPTPVANFIASNACPGNSITFTNQSSVPSGSLTYNWTFGDGTGSSAVSPTHIYTVAGTYSVTLMVTSANGCTASSSQAITIYPVPVTSFTAAPVCNGTAVQFDNTTSIASGFTASQWNFGDGTTSTDNDPIHLYAGPGIYTVTLISQSNNGCIDSISQLAQVFIQPSASFSASATGACLNDSITFTNNSTVGVGISYEWYFGDGDSSNLVSPSHTYAAAGTYTVTLHVNTTSGCTDSSSQTVTIFPKPVAGFTSVSQVCIGNIIQFNNTSTISSGSLTYLWVFSDGDSSTAVSPSHVYSLGGPGNYVVTLFVTSNDGCSDTVQHTITVNLTPIAQFTAVNSSVCDSVAVQFVDGSTVDVNTIYDWQFGDGDSSSSVSPSHVYPGPGTYTVTLTLTDTATGCNASTSLLITVFPKPNASFNAQNVCIGNPVQFNNTSTITSGTLSYVWNFGDSIGSIDISPAHLYDSIGIKNITLIATSINGCSDTVSNTVIIYPLPVADFSAGNMCFSKQVTFTNLTSIPFGTDTYLWNFGDGTTDTTTNPVHTFPALGVFNVTLTATSNEGCSNSVTIAVTINPNPTANFLGQNVCFGDSMQFTNLSSNSSGTFTSFWEFGDGFTSSVNEPAYLYAAAGTYNVTLVITSNNGCVDSISRPVTIYSLPSVAFVAPDVCIGFTTVFQNESQVTNGTISNTNWNFGDGQVSEQFSPTHTYAQPGSYNVSLEVISNQGCIDSLTKSVIVHNLPDDTIRALGPTAFCFGDSVTLSAGVTGQDFYLWSNGDTTQNITVTTGALYHVTVTSEYGCQDSDTITVTVWALPKANAGNDTTISKGYPVQLHGSGGITYYWTPDSALNNQNLQNPIATPLSTITYTVLVTDSNGCKDTASVTITVLDDYNVMIPNLFTPNNDGHNDFWVIINIETYPNCNVMVFDRMGDRVFESEAYHNQWDGTFNGKQLPDGTYYYVVSFTGVEKLYKGAVNILR